MGSGISSIVSSSVPEMALFSSGPASCKVLRPACNVTVAPANPASPSRASCSFLFLNLLLCYATFPDSRNISVFGCSKLNKMFRQIEENFWAGDQIFFCPVASGIRYLIRRSVVSDAATYKRLRRLCDVTSQAQSRGQTEREQQQTTSKHETMVTIIKILFTVIFKKKYYMHRVPHSYRHKLKGEYSRKTFIRARIKKSYDKFQIFCGLRRVHINTPL